MPWRIEHPDYQPADVAHDYDPDVGEETFGGGHKNYLVGPANNVWWHGSVSGDIGGGKDQYGKGLHVGDYQTAAHVLQIRFGSNPLHPEGRWTGEHSLSEAYPNLFDENDNPIPDENGWHQFKHYDGTTSIPGSHRPNVFPVAITGPMSNTTDTAVSDGQAHVLMGDQHRHPPKTPKGYYYINGAEGEGRSPETGVVSPVSAVVPSVDHVQKLDPAKYEHIAQEAHQNWMQNFDSSDFDLSKLDGLSGADREKEISRQTKEQENSALEWRDRRGRGF